MLHTTLLVNFERLCKSHAAVIAHQAKQFAMFQMRITRPYQQQKLTDMGEAWRMRFYAFVACPNYVGIMEQFIDLSFRSELPKVQAKNVNESEKSQKREKALLEARAKFDMLDVNAIAAIAAVEAQRGSAARDNQKVYVPQGSVLEHLVAKNPCLEKDFNFVLKNKIQVPAKAKAKSALRSRSSSARSWTSSRSAKIAKSSKSSSCTSSVSSVRSVRFASPSPSGKGASPGSARALGKESAHMAKAMARVRIRETILAAIALAAAKAGQGVGPLRLDVQGQGIHFGQICIKP